MSSSPPCYVLLSHSNLSSSSSNTTANPTPTLVHPTIQYQYRDDPPLSLPNSQHVLVMDYDPASPELVHAQSLSPQIAITSLRVTDAPGAGSVGDEDEAKNTKMYVLETVAHQPSDKILDKVAADDVPPVVSLSNFKQRNALLRKALEYPLPSAAPPPPPSSAPTVSPRPSPFRTSTALPSSSPTA